MKTVAKTLDVARSHLHDKLRRPAKARGAYPKQGDEVFLPLVRRLVDERPTYGYRRITALANRELATDAKPAANHKRVFRIMKRHGMLLARHTGRRTGRLHDGKVVVMRSNLRWCSDAFEIACWNGEIVRVVFVIDAHDREIIAWQAIAGAGISGSDGPRPDAGGCREHASAPSRRRSSARVADRQRQRLHRQGDARLRHRARSGALLHPGAKPGVERHRREPSSKPSSATMLASTLCRMRDTALRQIAGWFDDYNQNHPHSGLRMRSPREFIQAHATSRLSGQTGATPDRCIRNLAGVLGSFSNFLGRADVAPKFYPILSSLGRLVCPVWPG